jgi:glycosyltransferase involved in cell wall biosynthesis
VRGLSGFDVALAHQSTCATGLVAAGFSAPIALVFHASALRELRFLRAQLPVRRRIGLYGLDPFLACFERLSVGKAASILALSEFSKNLIEADHPQSARRIIRVTGGVDVERFSPGEGQVAARRRLGVAAEVPLLVTARRLEPRMGLESLLEATDRLRNSHPGLQLAIIGSGSLAAQLRARARELGIAAAVDFLGRVPDAELVDWYRAADLFVLPTVAYEGFGMVTVEALAAGTPVVGTGVGATPELLAPLDPALIARTADAGGLADAIAAALRRSGPDLREASRAYACASYAWSHVIDAWEQALVATSRNRLRAELPATQAARG